MSSTNYSRVVPGPASARTGRPHGIRGVVGTGLLAALAAMVATTLAGALARAMGVDFEVADGESIP
ncbi:DUF6069 family protein, partial [Nocardioides sp.]|uniref:DUF6069 family protein n=1 Tax=Nocardioides sp. TaxID=35761 RepID=UPI002732AC76